MASTNLSIVDSLIRSHFGSVLWTKSSDINFFNDDRITQINMCFKDLPVKSKLYILMALGNLDNATFVKWKDDVESLFLRAMVEGNLLVRAVATILQHKFSLNYLTFDISMSLETFSDVLIALNGKINEWDVGNDIIKIHYLSLNVIEDLRKRRKIIPKEDDAKKNLIGCNFRKLPKSVNSKNEFLKKLEFECNKKRISVPIPGKSKIRGANKDDMDMNIPNERQSIIKSIKESEQQRKELELDAKLEAWRRKHHQKTNEASMLTQKRDKGLICLSIDEMPISGPKAKQIQREKEREAKKAEKEERARRAKEEKEAEKIRKLQEKESKRLEAIEQKRIIREEQDKLKRTADEMAGNSSIGEQYEGYDQEDEDLVAASVAAENSTLQPPPSHVRIIQNTNPLNLNYNTTTLPATLAAPPVGHNTSQPRQFFHPQTNLTILQPQSTSNPQRITSSQIVLLRSPGLQTNDQTRFTTTGATPIRFLRLPSNPNTSDVNNIPRFVRILTTQGLPIQQQPQQQFISPPPPQVQPQTSIEQTQQIQSLQQPQQQQQQQSAHLEEMKLLIKYANRLTRPQKAMIVSFITRTADGVDFQGQSTIHLSSHRAVKYEVTTTTVPGTSGTTNTSFITQPRPLNHVVEAYFLMDYHTNRWSVTKQYREPKSDEELLSLELQPQGYPPELASS